MKQNGWMLALAVVCVAGMISCGLDKDYSIYDRSFRTATSYSLVLSGSGFTNGVTVSAYTKVSYLDQVIQSPEIVETEEGGFTIEWADMLQRGLEYGVYYYADINGDGECTDATDLVRQIDIAAAYASRTVTEDYTTVSSNASCTVFGPYALSIIGTGYGQYSGSTVGMNVFKEDFENENIVYLQRGSADLTDAGVFLFSWTGLMDFNESYEIYYYLDVDQSGWCTPFPEDLGWLVSVGPAIDHTDLMQDYEPTAARDVCDYVGDYKLEVQGSNFVADEGDAVQLAVLVPGTTPVVVQTGSATIDKDDQSADFGTFEFTWEPRPLVDGVTYEVHYYVDIDESGACELANDYVRSVSINSVSQDTTLQETPGLPEAADCAAFD